MAQTISSSTTWNMWQKFITSTGLVLLELTQKWYLRSLHSTIWWHLSVLKMKIWDLNLNNLWQFWTFGKSKNEIYVWTHHACSFSMATELYAIVKGRWFMRRKVKFVNTYKAPISQMQYKSWYLNQFMGKGGFVNL